MHKTTTGGEREWLKKYSSVRVRPRWRALRRGSLFPCPCEDREALLADIRQLNRRLSPKGLCLLPIRFLPGQALLYLYRPAGLRRDLRDAQASELLRQAGYGDEEKARSLFAKYKICTEIYCTLWQSGLKLEQLAVAV